MPKLDTAPVGAQGCCSQREPEVVWPKIENWRRARNTVLACTGGHLEVQTWNPSICVHKPEENR